MNYLSMLIEIVLRGPEDALITAKLLLSIQILK